MSENNGWIKCSERLPEIDDDYLVSVKKQNHKGDTVYRHQIVYFLDGWCIFKDQGDVTHWQSLPTLPAR